MRDIKFRVWIPSSNFMGVPFNPLRQFHELIGSFPDDAIFMQYTGLHDKNGKEIYEGDIVRATANGNRKYQIVWQDLGLGHWWIADIQRDNLIPNRIPIKLNAIEVIGNIYENPSLIPHNCGRASHRNREVRT